MVIAAGPRIFSSTMGPIPFAEAATGNRQVSVSVTFDRPIDPATVLANDVQVFYHGTSNSDPSIALPVISFLPTAGGNSPTTEFTIVFDASPAATHLYGYLQLLDRSGRRRRHACYRRADLVVRQRRPPDRGPDGPERRRHARPERGDDAVHRQDTRRRLRGPHAPAGDRRCNFLGAASILSPPFNQNTLPLIVPGPQVASTSVPGGNA